MSIESMMPFNHFTLSCPLLLLPSIFPSVRAFSNESALHISWPKYWCFSFSISPSNEYSGLISFRIDWVFLLAVRRTLRSLLKPQYKNINSLALSFIYGPTLSSIHAAAIAAAKSLQSCLTLYDPIDCWLFQFLEKMNSQLHLALGDLVLS